MSFQPPMRNAFSAAGAGLTSHPRPAASYSPPVCIAGVQAEVDPRPGMHTGGLYEAAGREWLVKPAPAAESALRIGGWNDMRILVRGPHVRTWVNAVPAVDYVDPSPKYTDGVIALQLHSGGEGRMRFKDILIREIQ